MDADTMRNQSFKCQLLIVKAVKAAYNSIKDTEGANLPVRHVCLHMPLLYHWKISAVTGGCV